MTLFIVTGEVGISQYMGSETTELFTHLVQAENDAHACRAVEAHYEAKTSEYSVYYSVGWVEASEMIVASPALLEDGS